MLKRSIKILLKVTSSCFVKFPPAKATKCFILLTIASMVNDDEADAVLQSVLLWTCARLFDWVITLFRDALACDEQEESNFYHSSMVYHK